VARNEVGTRFYYINPVPDGSFHLLRRAGWQAHSRQGRDLNSANPRWDPLRASSIDSVNTAPGYVRSNQA